MAYQGYRHARGAPEDAAAVQKLSASSTRRPLALPVLLTQETDADALPPGRIVGGPASGAHQLAARWQRCYRGFRTSVILATSASAAARAQSHRPRAAVPRRRYWTRT